MAKQENQYWRLPGKGFTSESSMPIFGGKSRLYLARDHLLRVNSNGWIENYRRFYFADIQGIVVWLNNTRQVWNALHLTICALFLLWLLAWDSVVARVILGCIAAFFFVMFLVNMLRGPTCLTRIQTRTGTEPLPSLQRLRKARQVIRQLQPYIEAAQGGLNPEEVPQRAAEFRSLAASAPQTYPVAMPAAQAPGTARRTNSYRGGMHVWMFGAFLLEAAALGINILSAGLASALFIMATVLPAAVLTIVALVKQSRSALATGVKTATWFGLVHMFLSFVGAYALLIAAIIENPKMTGDLGAIFIAMAQLDSPFSRGVYGFLAAFALIVALTGIITLLGARAAEPPKAGETSSQT